MMLNGQGQEGTCTREVQDLRANLVCDEMGKITVVVANPSEANLPTTTVVGSGRRGGFG